jgi:hypothetical protein
MRRFLGAIVLGVLASSLSPSAALAGARVYVRVGPPVAVVEVRPAAPSRQHVWVAGYHRWDGNAHVWVPGQWAVPPARYTAWVPGHWVHHPHNGWYWVEGHWRR